MSSPSETDWWVFFPIIGIGITNPQHDLDCPMFGDATIISGSHVKQIVSGHDKEEDLATLFNFAMKGAHSFVAVKRRGSAEHRVTSDSHTRLTGEIAEIAMHRAAQITSLIALSIISKNPKWETCGLFSQVVYQPASIAMISFETKGFVFQGHGRQSYTSLGNPLWVDRNALRELIDNSPANPVASILEPQSSPLNKSLRRAVIESSIRLTEAFHQQSPAARLLGAVTSIEILIAHQGDSYESSNKRIRELVGPLVWEQLEAERVMYERHLYVHRGKEPSHGFLPLKATALGLSCLIQFAKLIEYLPHKNAILNYLDFLYIGGKMSEYWSEEELQTFRSLLKHEPLQLSFPYFAEKKEATNK